MFCPFDREHNDLAIIQRRNHVIAVNSEVSVQGLLIDRKTYYFRARVPIPHTHATVAGCCDNALTVRAESRNTDVSVGTDELKYLALRLDVEYPNDSAPRRHYNTRT